MCMNTKCEKRDVQQTNEFTKLKRNRTNTENSTNKTLAHILQNVISVLNLHTKDEEDRPIIMYCGYESNKF